MVGGEGVKPSPPQPKKMDPPPFFVCFLLNFEKIKEKNIYLGRGGLTLTPPFNLKNQGYVTIRYDTIRYNKIQHNTTQYGMTGTK